MKEKMLAILSGLLVKLKPLIFRIVFTVADFAFELLHKYFPDHDCIFDKEDSH